MTQAALPTLQPLLSGRWNWAAGGFSTGVEAVGNHAYISLGSGGLVVLDVSNTTNCAMVGSYATVGAPLDVVVSVNYSYPGSFGGSEVIDVRALGSDQRNVLPTRGLVSVEGSETRLSRVFLLAKAASNQGSLSSGLVTHPFCMFFRAKG